MKKRIAPILVVALAAAILATSIASAAMVGIYRNGMESLPQRSQLIKLAGRSCARAGTESALRITVGKKPKPARCAPRCSAPTSRSPPPSACSAAPPAAVARKAFLGVELRAGKGAKYQLLVYPMQKKAQLVKVTPDGPEYYDIAKNLKTVMPLNGANTLRLQALKLRNGPEAGSVAVKGFLGRELVVSAPMPSPATSPARPRPSPSAPPRTAAASSPRSTTSSSASPVLTRGRVRRIRARVRRRRTGAMLRPRSAE